MVSSGGTAPVTMVVMMPRRALMGNTPNIVDQIMMFT
jgi:hypothetical protein